MKRKSALVCVFLLMSLPAIAQSVDSAFDQYVEQAAEFSSRARANVYFPNLQSIFRGAQFNFVNTGTGNLTFLRRDMVASGRIPLVVARVYDSSSRGTAEFGPGWNLSVAETISLARGKADLTTESGVVVSFVRNGETSFRLEKEYPSDYLRLTRTASDTFQAMLRTGLLKEFKLIRHEFRLTRVSDNNGNEIRLIYKNGLLARIENANHWIALTRSKDGRILSAQDDQDRKVSYAYDGQERLIEATDLGGHSWQYAYTEAGSLKTATDPLKRLNFGIVYDGSGRVSRLQLPSGQIQYNYDPTNPSTVVTDRKQLISRFFHNEEGVTTRVVNALGEETAIGLDSNRNVISLSRNGSIVESMEYDQQHRLLVRHSVTESGSVDRHYSYDPATGLLIGIKTSGRSDQTFSYDPPGNLASATLADGLHKFDYSPHGDLADISVPNVSLKFTADLDGLIASVTDDKNAVTALQYRAGGELAEASFPDRTQAKYVYQPSGLRAKLAYKDGRQVQYSYDPAGNLTETKVFDYKGKQVNGQKLEMNDSYQLVRWVRFDGTETTFQYDANGNLTEIRKGKSTTRFEYDALDRLSAVITPDGQRLTYTYKPGERSLIEQYEHASVMVADLRDTSFTFAHPLSATASRPLTATYGTVRFSDTLGTFQLANADGSEVVRPHENIEGALAKLHLFEHDATPNATQQDKQSSFNAPFNAMFMPAEYLTINCCPPCCTDPDMICRPHQCPCNPVPTPPVLTGISVVAATANAGTFPVTLTGTFNDASEIVNINGSGISANPNPIVVDLSGNLETNFFLTGSVVAGNYSISVTDSGGTSNSLTFKVIPVISSIQPDDGFVGDSVPVTIMGQGFGSNPTVTVGGNITVNYHAQTDTQIDATLVIPANTSSQGVQPLTVTNTGNNQSSQGNTFTVKARTATITIKLTGTKTPGDNLSFVGSNSACSENLGLQDCRATKGAWAWAVEVQANVNDDASKWLVSQSFTTRTKGFTKDSAGNLTAFDDPTPLGDDTPSASFIQQPSGQTVLFWIDAPGHRTNRLSVPIDSMTEVENITSTVCNRVMPTVCSSVNWYVKLIVNPGAVLDTTSSTAGLGSLPLNF